MKGVGGGNDHSVDIGIGEHAIIAAEGLFDAVGDGHAPPQIVRDIADGREIGIACLDTTSEMRRLRDLPRAEDSNAEPAVFLRGHAESEAVPTKRVGGAA